MLDDFFVRALIAGIGIAIIAGPFGCFIVWRRLSYFGDTLSHAALLGVALSFLLDINITLSVFGVSLIVALLLLGLQKRGNLTSDAILGMLSHTALALGLVALSAMVWIRVDLMGYLFGDILAVSTGDLALIYGGGGVVLVILIWIWRPLFAATVNRELAQAEGLNPAAVDLMFMLLMALVIAISIKVIGVLLITAMLIIPAAAARRLSRGPEQMAIIASLLGIASVVSGLYASLEWDTPSGPSIVVASAVLFVITMLPIVSLIIHRKRAISVKILEDERG